MCGGLLCCSVSCRWLFFPHYLGETWFDLVGPTVSVLWVCPFCTPWPGVQWRRQGSACRVSCGFLAQGLSARSGYFVGWWRVGVARCGGCGSLGPCCGEPGWACLPGTAGVCLWKCPPLGPVLWCGGVRCSLGGISPRSVPGLARWGAVTPSAWFDLLPWMFNFFSVPVSFLVPVFWPFPFPSAGVTTLVPVWCISRCTVAGPVPGRWAKVVIFWPRGVVSAPLRGFTPLTLCRGRWLVGVKGALDAARVVSVLVFGMRKNILEKSETRQNNRSFHMKREQKIAHFMKNTLFFEKMRNWHPNQSHRDASGSTISSLKHSLCF